METLENKDGNGPETPPGDTPEVPRAPKTTRKAKAKEPVLSPEEMAIFRRIKGDGREWETITEEDVDDYSLMEDPMKLPPQALELRKKKEFAFRWIERTANALDQMRAKNVPERWWIVNAESFPDMEALFDPILGCINRLDQMLVFKPYWMHVKRMDMVQQLTDAQDRAGMIESLDGVTTESASITAGKRSGVDPRPIRGEVKAGDTIEYEEASSASESQGVEDLVTE